eukprot:Awhi_evm1s13889
MISRTSDNVTIYRPVATDGGYGGWSAYLKVRTRECNSLPQFGGADCLGPSSGSNNEVLAEQANSLKAIHHRARGPSLCDESLYLSRDRVIIVQSIAWWMVVRHGQPIQLVLYPVGVLELRFEQENLIHQLPLLVAFFCPLVLNLSHGLFYL